jgi:putative ABC transport system substrate-binding protein
MCLAQQPGRNYRIGVLLSGPEPHMRRYLDALRERLALHGFVEGRNLRITWVAAGDTQNEAFEGARTLLASAPDAFFTFGAAQTLGAQRLKAGAPIIFTFVGDPVAYGIVKEIRRPGGNTTGASMRERETTTKRLELLRDLLPRAKRIGLVGYFLYTSRDIAYLANEPALRAAAASLGFELIEEPGATQAEGIVPAMERAARRGAEAFYIFQPLVIRRFDWGGEEVIKFANERRIPAIFQELEMVEMGGLLSYGPSLVDEVRRSADQLVRVLNGAKAGELAVDQASRFELTVNLKTARAIGLTSLHAVMPRADRVIE